MIYKIEIFKSESYQKILKAVLKFRYPDLSYEEAFEQEAGRDDSIEGYWSNYNNFGRPITLCELVDVLNANGNDFIYRDGRLEYQSSCQYGHFLAIKLEFTFKTYLLHEQTQKVIDQIANFLK